MAGLRSPHKYTVLIICRGMYLAGWQKVRCSSRSDLLWQSLACFRASSAVSDIFGLVIVAQLRLQPRACLAIGILLRCLISRGASQTRGEEHTATRLCKGMQDIASVPVATGLCSMRRDIHRHKMPQGLAAHCLHFAVIRSL